jgi:uncharacterized protein
MPIRSADSPSVKLGVVAVLALMTAGVLAARGRVASGEPAALSAESPSSDPARGVAPNVVMVDDLEPVFEPASVAPAPQAPPAARPSLAAAVRTGSVAEVRKALEGGGDVHEDEDAAVPPLLEADAHADVTALLLAQGAKEPELVDAVRLSAPNAVSRLLAKGADANTDVDGERVLHLALANAQHEGDGRAESVVRALVLRGARVDADALVSATRAASASRRDALLSVLLGGALERDATVNAIAELAAAGEAGLVRRLAAKGVTWKALFVDAPPPLVLAAERGDRDVVSALLGAGAPLEEKDPSGRTALLAAITSARPDSEDAAAIVKMLLARGANPNRRAEDGTRPLYAAAERGERAMVSMLLARGAHVNDEVAETTPLEAAEAGGHQSVVKLLRARGAKVREPD